MSDIIRDKTIAFPHFISNKPCGIDKYAGKSQERLTQAIAKHIIDTDNTGNALEIPRIIGLEGTWGSGKSNVIKQLNKKLEDTYFVFEYDAWGHQEDLQRRSFLETLTTKLIEDNFFNNIEGCKRTVDNNIDWKEKLKHLLAHKTIRINKSIPKLNRGAILTALLLCSTPISTFVSEKLESNCIIHSILILTLIAFSPIIAAIIVWIINSMIHKNMWDLGYFLQITKNENTETENHETINDEEPTVAKFKKWMNDLSNYIKEKSLKKLVIVFDNMDRLPADKVKELWSSIHTFFAEGEFKNIWTIIPFDQKHLSSAFGEDETKSSILTNYLISKTFPIVYRVALPVITDYRAVFSEIFREAFDAIEDANLDKINLMFRLENPNVTVRDIIAFINQLVSLKIIWGNEIEIIYMAIFTLQKDTLLNDSVNQILSGSYLDDKIKKLQEDNDVLRKNISALVYGIDPNEAEQIPISKYIDSCLKCEEGYDINTYSQKHGHFIGILNDKIHELEQTEYDNAIKMMSNLDLTDFSNDKKCVVSSIWQYFSEQRILGHLSILKFENVFELLLININGVAQETVIAYLCREFQNVKQYKTFKGDEYWKAINSLSVFLKKNKIDYALPLKEIDVDTTIFIDVVYEAKEEYTSFKVKTDPVKLDKYFAELVPNKLIESKYSILHHLKNDTKYKFDNLKASIEKSISGSEIVFENFGAIFYMYKSIHHENGKLSKQLTSPQIQTLWGSFNSHPEAFGYYDIVAMQFNNGVNITLTDSQIENVANSIDYFSEYGGLLISSLSWNIPSLNAVLKFMTEKQLGQTLLFGNILPNFFAIIKKINVTEAALLIQLNRWRSQNSSITDDNIETIIPKEMYLFTIKTKNELTSHINALATKKLSVDDINALYSQKGNSATYYNFSIANVLVGTEYMEQLPDNLTELAKKILIDIASGNEKIPKTDHLFYKIIMHLDWGKRGPIIKDVKNKFCNTEYTISPELFLYFEDWFEKQGDLEDRADRVTTTILQPVASNDDCLSAIASKPEIYVNVVKKAGDDATSFKEIVKKKIEGSPDKQLIDFAEKIGIKNAEHLHNAGDNTEE